MSNSSKKTKVKRTKKSRRGRKPKQDHFLYSGLEKDQIIVPRRFRAFPPSMVTTLTFMSTLHSPLNNAGLTYASFRLRPSSAFDVDPTIGGTSMPGFNEIAGAYGRYRMIRFRTSVTAVNLETFPVNLIAFPSNFDLGNNYSLVQSMFGNTFASYRYLSPQGGLDRATILTRWYTAAEILGTDAPLVDTDFSATVATSPVNNTYMNYGIWTGNASNLVSGIGLQVTLDIEYRFYEAFHLVTLPVPTSPQT